MKEHGYAVPRIWRFILKAVMSLKGFKHGIQWPVRLSGSRTSGVAVAVAVAVEGVLQ